MPLTPLRRQLRSVLASLRYASCEGSATPRARAKRTLYRGSIESRPPGTRPTSKLHHHAPVRQQSAVAALAVEDERPVDWSASVIFDVDDQQESKWRRQRSKRRANTTEALRYGARDDGRSRRAFEGIPSSPKEPMQSGKYESSGSFGELVTLETILARYLQHQDSAQPGHAEWDNSFTPTSKEAEHLAHCGYTMGTVEEWATIVSTADSLEAASSLCTRMLEYGHLSTPIFVFNKLLQREYVSARALRLLVKQAEDLFESREGDDCTLDHHVFNAFLRLFRHARKVWPAALDRIARILLDHLAPVKFEGGPDFGQLQRLTHMLNKVMRLIVVPTAIEPIKNNTHQEAALVRVLKFMANHKPTLQISREGYRAVVLLQLAQRKTESEQQWAELKALSWPPWKEERTAMDDFIAADDHGVSKAAETLLRMREAGYGHHGWEKTAMVYAGWDTDRTPTIQTLTLLGMVGTRFETGTATWAGRIAATRTAQEAWAAYLAWEAQKNPRDQEVYLAILSKLQKEDARRSKPKGGISRPTPDEQQGQSHEKRRLHPGDVQEVWPLPPSTHLHTYTRSPPPTMDEFYGFMRKHGISPNARVHAFLVANAGNLRRGMMYLTESGYTKHVVQPLIDLDHQYDITDVPMPLYVAFIQLLCRSSKVPVALSEADALDSAPRGRVAVLDSRKITKHIAIVHAIALLQWRQPLHLPPYNAVLQSLGFESSLQNLRSVESPKVPIHDRDISKTTPEEQEQERLRGAVTAYRLGRRVVSLMREVHLDLDIDGFRALCNITENAAIATWTILRDAEDREHQSWQPTPHIHEALEWLRSTSHVKRLKGDFRILVGDDRHREAERDGPGAGDDVPPLEIPSFSLLHAYVRALGWMADYEGLLQTARWMHARAAELATRQKQDRNGGVMLHRTLCALRAFLERSWLLPGHVGPQEGREEEPDGNNATASASASDDQGGDPGSAARPRPRLAKQLLRLRSPAPQDVIEEAKRIVQDVEVWGGWPGEEDVERYCRGNRRFARVAS